MTQPKIIWHDGKFIPEEKATVSLLSHSLHYGSGAFEGIRCYETQKGPAIFKLKAHIERLFYSASVVGITLPYEVSEVCEFTCDTVRENHLKQGYIRPLAYWHSGEVRIASKNLAPSLMIACWSLGKYLMDKTAHIKIAKTIRLHPQSTVSDAKLTGNYINSILASREIENTDYHEVLLKDYKGHIAEGAGENFFIVKDGVIYTPPTGNILPGITRDTLFELTKKLGLKLVEKDLNEEDALDADEAFFTGTAAEVTPISKIDTTVINDGDIGPITQQIQTGYNAIVRGEDADFIDSLTFI